MLVYSFPVQAVTFSLGVDMTYLIESVLKNDLCELRAGLAQGGDPNERSGDGRTLLILATIEGELEMVKLLLEQGGDINAQDDLGYSALHYAAQNYLPKIATHLVGWGARVDIEDNHGNTPLGRAVFDSRGRGEVITILLNAGADKNHCNKHSQTPLSLAKLIANFDIAQFF